MVSADEYVQEDNLLFPGSIGTAAGDTQEEEDNKQNEDNNLCCDQDENKIDCLDHCLTTVTEENQVNNLNGVEKGEVTQRECEENTGK